MIKKILNFTPKDLTTLFTLVSKIIPIFAYQTLNNKNHHARTIQIFRFLIFLLQQRA